MMHPALFAFCLGLGMATIVAGFVLFMGMLDGSIELKPWYENHQDKLQAVGTVVAALIIAACIEGGLWYRSHNTETVGTDTITFGAAERSCDPHRWEHTAATEADILFTFDGDILFTFDGTELTFSSDPETDGTLRSHTDAPWY
jgi:hypothetical protein